IFGLSSAISGHLPIACDVANKSGAERNTQTNRAATAARFRLDNKLARGVVKFADADVILVETALQLLSDLGEHLVGVESGDGVSRNGIEQRKVTGLGSFFLEQTGILDGDARFA